MVLVVGGAGEGFATTLFRTHIRPLAGVGADVNFADVGGCEITFTPLKRTLERLFSCKPHRIQIIIY